MRSFIESILRSYDLSKLEEKTIDGTCELLKRILLSHRYYEKFEAFDFIRPRTHWFGIELDVVLRKGMGYVFSRKRMDEALHTGLETTKIDVIWNDLYDSEMKPLLLEEGIEFLNTIYHKFTSGTPDECLAVLKECVADYDFLKIKDEKDR